MLGDSIAVGVGTARPECQTTARIGITSEAFVQTMLTPADTQTLIVSLGANDDGTVHTEQNLRELRQTVRAQSVIWLLPGLKDPQRAIIRSVAASYGDRLIDTRPQAGPDHLHPSGAGYRLIAEETQSSGPEAIEVAEAEAPRTSFAARPGSYGYGSYRTGAYKVGAYRMGSYRAGTRRVAAARAGSSLPVPPLQPPASALVRRTQAKAVRADERVFLSDGQTCVRFGARVSCQLSPRPSFLIDPARDHRRAQGQAFAN